jgi:hypothetical protein
LPHTHTAAMDGEDPPSPLPPQPAAACAGVEVGVVITGWGRAPARERGRVRPFPGGRRWRDGAWVPARPGRGMETRIRGARGPLHCVVVNAIPSAPTPPQHKRPADALPPAPLPSALSPGKAAKRARKSMGRRVSFAPDAVLETRHMYRKVRRESFQKGGGAR